MTRCRECGAEAEGKYCAQCGASLGGDRACADCGAELAAGDRYCSECGAPATGRARKPLSAYLPWILSAVALVLFAVAITLLLQEEASPRAEGMPPTGSVIQGGEGSDAGDPASGGAGPEMPSAGDLAAMGPREAADRLFDRTMRERETGSAERARFFAGMALQAYERVPPGEWDADAHFHAGMLALIQGDTAAARARADSVLSSAPGHLLGHLLAARAASTPDAREAHMDRFRRSADTVDLGSRPEYRAHRSLIEGELGGGPDGAPPPPGRGGR